MIKTFQVYLTYKDGTEDTTQICAKNVYEGMEIVRGFIADEKKSTEDIVDIRLQQVYDEFDHREYKNNYDTGGDCAK